MLTEAKLRFVQSLSAQERRMLRVILDESMEAERAGKARKRAGKKQGRRKASDGK